MAYTMLWHDSFEYATADRADMWDEVTGAPAISASGRFGNAVQFTDAGTDPWLGKFLTVTNEFTMGAAFNFATIGSTNSYPIFQVAESGSLHLGLRATITTPYDLEIIRGTTVLATIDTNWSANTWHHVVLSGKIHDTTGYYYLYLDGSSTAITSATNTDTQNAGTGTCDRVRIGLVSSVAGNGVTRMDDFYIASVTSGPEWLGDLRAALLVPNAAGNYTQFTPLSSTNQSMVDETSPDGDTTYNETATVSNMDTFGLSNLPTAAGTIYGVKTVLRARKTDAGSRTVRSMMRAGSTDYEDSDLVLADSYQTTKTYRTVNPNTSSAFTESDINSGIEIGYKVQA